MVEKIEEITDEKWMKVSDENRQIVEEFLKQSTHLSDKTLLQYTSALRIFFFWVSENLANKSFHKLKPRDFLLYQNWLVNRGISSSNIRLKRSAVSSLNSYVTVYYEEEYPTFRNYINKAVALPPQNFINEKEPLTLKEYDNLCQKLEKRELFQQLAYIRFSFSTGARRAEVRQLLKEVVDYEPKISEVNGQRVVSYNTHNIRCKGKGKIGKIRKLQFDQDAMDAIKKWLTVRGEDDCPYVFVIKKDGKWVQVGESTFNFWTKHFMMEIVGRRFHPHLIRSSRATSLVVEHGKDINVAKKLLGHESSETTQIYVHRDDEDDADEAFV